MSQKSGPPGAPAETLIRDIRSATREHSSVEEETHIMLTAVRSSSWFSRT